MRPPDSYTRNPKQQQQKKTFPRARSLKKKDYKSQCQFLETLMAPYITQLAEFKACAISYILSP